MERLEELTATYLDGALSPAEMLELDNLLRADPQAAWQFMEFYAQDRILTELYRSEDVRAIETIMADVRREEGAFVGSVMEQVREQAPPRAVGGLARELNWIQRLWPSPLVWAGAAAMLLIAVSVFVFFPVMGKPVLLVAPGNVVTLERDGAELPAFAGLRLQSNDVLILTGTNTVAVTYAPEKTRIDLQPGATLKLLEWTKGKRFDLQQGKLEASVARQRPFKPMLVRTPEAEARVLGTRFTLSATRNHTRLDVAGGLVGLTRRNDRAAVKVSAGHYAIVAGGTELNALPQTGAILREIWTGIPGGDVRDLLEHPDYPARPAHRDLVKTFETPVIETNNFGCRLVGYLHPLVTGDYTFWIAGGGDAYLWLSPDDNPSQKIVIATASGGLPREWDAPVRRRYVSMPQSAKIPLVAGRCYLIQAAQKTASGSSHLAVAWQPPSGQREVISGEFLSPFKTKK